MRSLFAAALACLPLVSAYADIPPPPGAMERSAAALISQAGHRCQDVSSLSAAPASDAAAAMVRAGLTPQLAVCNDGKRFLVAWPPRRYGAPRPNAPPPPQPMVQPLP